MQAALAAAKEQDALQFAYALAVADPENGKLVLDKYRWYQGLKRPALAMRWGIGVDYNKPRNFSGDPKPIGSHQNLPKKGRRGSRGGGGDFGGGDFGGAPGGGLGIPGGDFGGGQFGGGGGGGGSGFERLTGKLGDKVLEQLKIRLGRGDFGELLKSAPRGRPGGFSGGIAGGGYGGAPGIPGVPGGGGGLPGGEGIPGAGGYGGAGGDGGGAGGGAGGAGGSGGQRLMPGVAYLGEGSKKELFRQAAEQGLDVLLIFDVNVTQNPRSRLTMNNTKVEMYTVADRGRIDATKVLNNIEIQREKDQTKDRDTIKREVENLFKTADQSGLRASDLPASLQPEHIKRRIGTLTGDAHDNPLWVLSEVQFYHYRKFLTDEEVKLAYNAFVGEDTASKLTTGSAAQRLQVMQRWLPKVEAAGRGQAPGQFGR